MDPVVLIQVGQDAVAEAPVLTEACTAALRLGTCVVDGAERPSTPSAVAIVAWAVEPPVVIVQVSTEQGGAKRWVTRRLVFSPADATLDRWRAVGLTIATLVGDLEAGHGEARVQDSLEPGATLDPHSGQAPGVLAEPVPAWRAAPSAQPSAGTSLRPEPRPRQPSTPSPAPASADGDQRRLQARLFGAAEVTTTREDSALAAGVRTGVGFTSLGGWLGGTLELSDWGGARDPAGLRLTCASGSVAVGPDVLLEASLSLRPRWLLVGERWKADVEADGAERSTTRWLPAAGARIELGQRLSPHVGLVAGFAILRRSQGLRLHVDEGDPVLVSAWGQSGMLGLELFP